MHREIIEKHKRNVAEEEQKQEQDKHEISDFSAERIASIIAEENKGLQQILRESDVNDMVR